MLALCNKTLARSLNNSPIDAAGVKCDATGWLWVEATLWHTFFKRCHIERDTIYELGAHPVTDLTPCFVVIRPRFKYQGDLPPSALELDKKSIRIEEMMHTTNGIPCDGVVFSNDTNDDADDASYKWKPESQCTIDLCMNVCSKSYVKDDNEMYIQVKLASDSEFVKEATNFLNDATASEAISNGLNTTKYHQPNAFAELSFSSDDEMQFETKLDEQQWVLVCCVKQQWYEYWLRCCFLVRHFRKKAWHKLRIQILRQCDQ